MPKSKSADDMDLLLAKEIDIGSPERTVAEATKLDDPDNAKASNHLSMIANRAQNVQRKNKKMKSTWTLIQAILTSRSALSLSYQRNQANFQTTTESYQESVKVDMGKSSRFNTKRQLSSER